MHSVARSVGHWVASKDAMWVVLLVALMVVLLVVRSADSMVESLDVDWVGARVDSMAA